ncbi:KilA-N domain-containing protein [Thiovulum sp. ES]|nr:KilA-N domain-containing protein [Thiovulum sp. ES]
MNESILTYNYKGKIEIDFLKSENLYLNATETAKNFGKDVREWKRAKQTIEYIEALTDVGNFHIENLIFIRKGGNNKKAQGTWIHKKLILSFARWLDPYFAVWCDGVIEEILTTGSYSIAKHDEPDLEKIKKRKLN